MKKYAKLIQIDARGQIIIPKEVRLTLGIDEGCGFYLYTIENEGIVLKKINTPELESPTNENLVSQLKSKAKKINMNQKNIDKSIKNYKRKQKGNFEEI